MGFARRRTAFACAALIGVVGLTSPHARAQEEASAADRASARELGIAGVMLAEKGKCNEAIEKLERAEKLYHAPTTLDRLGECQIEVGRVVEGTENLQRVVREALPANPPKAFVTAKARAQAALKKALPRIAKLRIQVSAPDGTEIAVTIDKEPLSSASIGTNRPTDPGTHTIEATGPGMLPAQQTVTLKEGDSQAVSLKLEPDPNAPKTPPPNVDAHGGNTGGNTGGGGNPPPPPPPPEGGGSKVLAYGLLGVGVAGVAVGTVTGVMALGKKSDIDGKCPDKSNCPTSVQSDIDSGKTLGLVSTIGFIVGGVGLVGGTVLLLTSGSGSASASTSGALPPKKAHAITAEPVLGAGYLGVRGAF